MPSFLCVEGDYLPTPLPNPAKGKRNQEAGCGGVGQEEQLPCLTETKQCHLLIDLPGASQELIPSKSRHLYGSERDWDPLSKMQIAFL